MKYAFHLLLWLLFFVVVSCKTRQTNTPSEVPFDPSTMEKMWKTVDSLENKGLHASALEEIIRIKLAAQSANESGHLVKAIMYENRYMLHLEEDATIKALQRGEAEIKNYPEPAKSVMHAMLGDWYSGYLRSHLWELNQRTEFEGPAGPDIRTWGVRHFIDKIQHHYLNAVQWPGLKSANVGDYTLLLTEDQKTDNLRPTLYDILMHKAIDYYSGAESFLTQPAYAFVLTDSLALATAGDFVRHQFHSTDTLSSVWITLNWFQQLLTYRLEDTASGNALLDADLKRLLFAYQHLIHDRKDSLYINALNGLLNQYKGTPESALISYHIAEWHTTNGDRWNRLPDDPNRYGYVRALEICQQTQKLYPDAYGSKLCQSLISRIKQTTLSANVESINLPDRELLAKIDYRNFDRVYCTVVQLPSAPRKWLEGRMDGDEMLKRLAQLPTVKSWTQSLDTGGDYQQHATEIALPGLPAGHYALLLSDGEKPAQDNATSGSVMFSISSLAYWFLDDRVGSEIVAVVNRATGQPEPGVKVEYFTSEYNPALRQHEEVKLGEATSGSDGWVRVPAHENKSVSLRLTKGKDELYMDDAYYSYRPRTSNAAQPVTLFFTDRAIYRPGQKLFFKGFAINFDQDRIPSSTPKKEITVSLYDANQREIGKQSLTTNDYGTFFGHFDLPQGGMTGMMSIASSHGSSRHAFRVEEYKRPRFEIRFDSIRESYRLGDDVVVKGIARDFAGSPVPGAMASYRVERVAYHPWWWGGYGRYWPMNNDRQVLTTGKAMTDPAGAVDIPFTALSNPSDDNGMMYNFEVTLAITDITGETHESTKVIALNHQGFEINVNLPESIALDKLSQVVVTATNAEGVGIEANGEVTISKLLTPDHHQRERLWQAPDILTLTSQEYQSRFNDYAEPGKEHVSSWPVSDITGTGKYAVTGKGVADLSKSITSAGQYKLSWSWKNKEGRQLTFDQFVAVFEKNKLLPTQEVVRVDVEDKAYAPGDVINFGLLTGLKSTPPVIRFVEHRKGSTEPTWISEGNAEPKVLTVKEEDRGGILVYHLAAYNNRFYRTRHLMTVPWTNKMLDVSLVTWRDKVEPGDDETWSLSVKGKNKEKVTAEVLLSMYDASLDQFVPHQWQMSLFPDIAGKTTLQSASAVAASFWGLSYKRFPEYVDMPVRQYRAINTYGYYPEGGYYGSVRTRGGKRQKGDTDMILMEANEAMPTPSAMPGDQASGADIKLDEPSQSTPEKTTSPGSTPPLRTALDETVFFFPQMKTDEQGNLTFSFKMKEGLTRWKFQALGYSRDLSFGLTTEELVTRKNLMVFPNPPRFFREGDTIAFQAKITNLSESPLSGTANLRILDAISGEDVTNEWGLATTGALFKVNQSGAAPVSWTLKVPALWTRPVKYQVSAMSGSFTDGEEAMLPVITNRVLITETLPLPVKANETKTFVFQSMLDRSSASLSDHRYVVEMTTSPAWYAVQALPYLMEYPHECSEQVFSRLYANTLAAHIANKFPAIRNVYDTWRLTDSDALLSNLEKNEELKNALLDETPWVRDAMGETSQKKNIALLFEQNRLDNEARQSIQLLKEAQLSNGGFPWFPGGRDNWYITQYIAEGFGHLRKLEVKLPGQGESDILIKAIPYLDARMAEWYEELKSEAAKGRLKLEDSHVGAMQVHYLYTRSFFPEIEQPSRMDEVNTYLLEQVRKYWLQHSLYNQGLIASGLHRRLPNDPLTKDILASLRERTIYHEELGRYWKVNPGYHWNESGIELQSLMVELFQDMDVPQAEVDELRVWLLKQKQTTRWSTTKSTASAIYALLIHPDTWLSSTGIVVVKLGDTEVIGKASDPEAGTGYVKRSWDGDEIQKQWSSVTVTNPNAHITWGAAYWQYWEDLDKVKSPVTDNPLKISRSLLITKDGDRGETSAPADARKLKVGDKLIVRLEVESDRAMDYVHLKDLRASGFEPVDVLSGYRWKGGIGYYQSTKDLATHFFIDHLPRGKYILEYTVTVAQAGQYSEGLAQLQCMYAPEFGSHSKGSRVSVTLMQ